MALQPISEQTFRTRRRDRRMVWVDAGAILAGTLLLTATVGAVVLVEPAPEPIEWTHSFFTSTTKHKNCAGITDATAARGGCTDIVMAQQPEEGTTIDNLFPAVDQPNVTRITFRLSWVDDVPVTEGEYCGNDCGWNYPYDDNGTDILRLTVHPPAGPAHTMEAANDVHTQTGSLTISFDLLSMPEPGSVMAFSQREAHDQVIDRYTAPEHDALGAWRAEVTVVRAGDQEGTVPIDACAAALAPTGQDPPDALDRPLPSSAGGACDTDRHAGTVEKDESARAALQASPYEASYDDEDQSWILELAIAHYASQVTVA